MITYKIEVLPIDLKGERNDSTRCPVALACKRSFPNDKINVGTRILTIGQRSVYLPNMAQDFVRKWDDEEEIGNLPTFYVNF